MLGEVVGEVFGAFSPVHVELPLSDPVADPVEAHVDGFRSLLLDGVIGDAVGACVVGLDRRDGLWVAEFGERGANHASVLAVEEQGADFGFRGGAGDDAHDVAVYVDSAVSRWGSGHGGWLTCAVA